MDAFEYQLNVDRLEQQRREFELRERELTVREHELAVGKSEGTRTNRTAKRAVAVAALSFLVSTVISSATVVYTSGYYRSQIQNGQEALLNSQTQFVQTARAAE